MPGCITNSPNAPCPRLGSVRPLSGRSVRVSACNIVQVRIMQWVGQETMYDLRKEIFEHLQRLPMSFFDRSPGRAPGNTLTTDVDALNDLFASGVVAMLNDFVLLFGLAIFLLPGTRIWRWPLFAAAVYGAAHLFLPQSRARRQPPHSHGNRAHQRFPAGTHQRHVRGAAFQS